MRPIAKGQAPFVAAKYSGYQSPLFDTIGGYCSYCEMPLPHDVEIEHKLPKKQFPAYAHDWQNLLLSCKNCNASRRKTLSNYHKHYWPDLHNPFYYLDFSNGLVRIKNGLNSRQLAKIQNTIDLVKLDIKPQNNVKDQRWQKRKEAFDTACMAKQCLIANSSNDMVDFILQSAKNTGFWSIWMTVFATDTNIKKRLVNEFTGTCQTCFDSNLQPIKRP